MPFGFLPCAPTSGKHISAAFLYNLVVTVSYILSLNYIE